MIELISDRALWNWWSPVWLVAASVTMIYGRYAGWTNPLKTGWLIAGLSVLVFAFVSPLGVLADGFPFSAHMIQHLLLLLVVPLCLVLSLPASLTRPPDSETVQTGAFRRAMRRLVASPVAGWSMGLGAMWFWHVPAFCSAATEDYTVGVVRTITFLVSGVLFWWPIYSPAKQARMPASNAVVYLFSACLGCTLLGIYITFTTITVCPAFASPQQRLAIMIALHDAGMTSSVDQQLGGLLMWVPPCSLYVAAIIGVFCRWYSVEEQAKVGLSVTQSVETTG
jgi:cytochrome c oxidase assembly factor CtaG